MRSSDTSPPRLPTAALLCRWPGARRGLVRASLCVLGLMLWATAGLAQAQPAPTSHPHPLAERLTQEEAQTVVPDGLLVKFRSQIGRQQRQAALAQVALHVHHFEDNNHGSRGQRGLAVFDQLVHVTLRPEVPLEAALEALAQDPT